MVAFGGAMLRLPSTTSVEGISGDAGYETRQKTVNEAVLSCGTLAAVSSCSATHYGLGFEVLVSREREVCRVGFWDHLGSC